MALQLTVIIAVKNEEKNIKKCIESVHFSDEIFVIDSQSTDDTIQIAESLGAKVKQFDYQGGYPKKRQWALENLSIENEWVLMLDADEEIPPKLVEQIKSAIGKREADAYLVKKGFHFMGKRMKYGGFSHEAILLFKKQKASYEEIFEDDPTGLDMEVHERVIVDGKVSKLSEPLIHEDYKGLEAYLDRHNKYSTWEAKLRYNLLTSNEYGNETIEPKLWGDSQERRRFLKQIIVRMPFESTIWFIYHYIFRLGFLEGRRGFMASKIRAEYIGHVNDKVYELNNFGSS